MIECENCRMIAKAKTKTDDSNSIYEIPVILKVQDNKSYFSICNFYREEPCACDNIEYFERYLVDFKVIILDDQSQFPYFSYNEHIIMKKLDTNKYECKYIIDKYIYYETEFLLEYFNEQWIVKQNDKILNHDCKLEPEHKLNKSTINTLLKYIIGENEPIIYF